MILPRIIEPAKFKPVYFSFFPRLLLTLINLVSIYEGSVTIKKLTKVPFPSGLNRSRISCGYSLIIYTKVFLNSFTLIVVRQTFNH